MSFTNAHEIVPRLWLGNKEASQDTSFLASKRIGVIFNCTKDLPFLPIPTKKYRVPIDDNLQPDEINNLYRWAPEIILKLIREYQAGNTVLVHCYAGMQRSAAVVAMFLVATTRRPTEEIKQFIRKKRPIAFFPMANFDSAIKRFDTDLQNRLTKT